MQGFLKKMKLPGPGEALPGRHERMPVPERHFVNGHPLAPPYPSGMELALFGLGCFWGAEKRFWQLPGVYVTAAGYAGGLTPNPTYQEVCSGLTEHNEVVRVVFDPKQVQSALSMPDRFARKPRLGCLEKPNWSRRNWTPARSWEEMLQL